MEKFIGILGILAILGIAYLLSNNKNKINFKLIFWGLSLQMFFAIIILKVPGGKPVFDIIDSIIKKILDFSVEGSKFLFGNLAAEEFHFCKTQIKPNISTMFDVFLCCSMFFL